LERFPAHLQDKLDKRIFRDAFLPYAIILPQRANQVNSRIEVPSLRTRSNAHSSKDPACLESQRCRVCQAAFRLAETRLDVTPGISQSKKVFARSHYSENHARFRRFIGFGKSQNRRGAAKVIAML
jgi:hypothetical protein